MSKLFEGKKFLVLGVANEKSIAWGITQTLAEGGATIALTYMNEALEKRVRPLADKIQCDTVLPCDVQSDEDLDNLFAELKERWGSIDGIVHSVAYADKEDLKGEFIDTSRDGFKLALDISAYSLVALASRGSQLMSEGGSIITLSYLGAERVITNYKVMGVAKAALEASVRYLAYDLGERGIRVNAISAGPMRTLAAAGIPEFKKLLVDFAARSPLKRFITQDDVSGTAAYLLSHLSSGVTGETIYVDGGFNIMGC